MKIGILSKNYAATRLFLNKVATANYKDIRFYNFYLWRNVHLWFLRAIGKLKMSPEEQASKLFYDYKACLPINCDICHFFNTINYSKHQSWVVSVESGIPWSLEVIKCVESSDVEFSVLKQDEYVKRALFYLSQKNCKGLLALSRCSYKIQLEILKQFPQYLYIIKEKLITLYPPQELQIHSLQEKKLIYSKGKAITFVYVGRDFFRKGGRETIQVLSELHNKYDIKLTLISDLRIDEIKYIRTNKDIQEAKDLITKNSSWIDYYPFLPNSEVIEKIKHAHVALLPTWMDTFGYSVLECQACGTPVISTSLRALTEINDETVGWLIKVPVNRLNNPIHVTKEEQDVFSKCLLEGLREEIEWVIQHPDEIKQKAENSLKRIAECYSPDDYCRKLEMIYNGRISELVI